MQAPQRRGPMKHTKQNERYDDDAENKESITFCIPGRLWLLQRALSNRHGCRFAHQARDKDRAKVSKRQV